MSQTMVENTKKCIANLNDVVSAKVIASANVYGYRFFEVRLSDKDDRYQGTVNVHLSKLKELNVTKSINGFKKVQAWLDTPIGLEYVITVKKRTYERDLRKHETQE
ncbi:hypothetical protein QNH20_18415 [Neobacillus sp. WH10]|uniref:hypothetical protein n=1 Tax=Neobacillus sp. WH10 TaxID=3047873 RepID=UPI0024C15EE9|nr:hypothetical protein [Neobacillus sp. WH10]WHY76087.1 hypothetical protein QNH20_18415 [Neobacillus sp. WH10]